MAAELIRTLEPDESSFKGASQLDEFEEGDKVEALYKGKGTKWFSGVVKRVNRDGTYEIRYDDGDNEVEYIYCDLLLFFLLPKLISFYLFKI